MKNNPTLTIPSLSGTFGIHKRLALNPKMPKEPSSPSLSNEKIANPHKTKYCAKLKRNYLYMNTAQCLIVGG